MAPLSTQTTTVVLGCALAELERDKAAMRVRVTAIAAVVNNRIAWDIFVGSSPEDARGYSGL
jgi:hypothetical protein